MLPLIHNCRQQGSNTMDKNLTTELENLCSVHNPLIRRYGSHQGEIHKNVNLATMED